MNSSTFSPAASASTNAVAALRRIASGRGKGPASSIAAKLEHCELCSIGLPPEHRHLLELATHKIICSCEACGFRFQDVVGGRFKLIPRDVRSLPDFRLTDADWDAFALPINLAFFFRHGPTGKMAALYPSPAGATESLLTLSAWESLVAENPELTDLQPDVEALLINRVGERQFHYIAPVDICFELVGLIRLHWKGFTGGQEVWTAFDAFFARLEERARPLRKEATRA